MDLADQAAIDAQAIIDTDGTPVVLRSPAAVTYNLHALNYRRGMSLDADGLSVISESSSITLSLLALSAVGIADPEALKAKGWTVTVKGSAYRIDAAPIDYTSGVVTAILKRQA